MSVNTFLINYILKGLFCGFKGLQPCFLCLWLQRDCPTPAAITFIPRTRVFRDPPWNCKLQTQPFCFHCPLLSSFGPAVSDTEAVLVSFCVHLQWGIVHVRRSRCGAKTKQKEILQKAPRGCSLWASEDSIGLIH